MAFRRREIESPRIDLTPMIDVVFLLLIFFMISTTFVERSALNIDLPNVKSFEVQAGTEEVPIYLGKDGEIFYQQQQLTYESLKRILNSFGASTAQMTFLLMADKDALHGRVIQLMDLAKNAGFSKLAIATDKDTQGH